MASRKKLLFVHIPKNAGSSINQYFSKLLSPSQTHIESMRVKQYEELRGSVANYISGHVRVFECMSFLRTNEYLRTTIVRDPFDHIISHINWVLYICEDVNSDIYKRHPRQVRELGHLLQGVDFSKPDEVELFVRTMPDAGHVYFNNCQTRYLLNASETLLITVDQGEQAIEDLSFFDVIGLQSDLKGFIKTVCIRLNLMEHNQIPLTNSLANKANLPKSAELKWAFRNLLSADQKIYNYVTQLLRKQKSC